MDEGRRTLRVRRWPGPAAWGLVLVAVAVVPPYALGGDGLRSAIFVCVATASISAAVFGPRLNASPLRRPWRVMIAAAWLFLAGAVLRTALAGPHGLQSMWPDAATLPGYVCFTLAIASLLRARKSGRDSASLTDAVVVGVAATMLAWQFLMLPTLGHPGHGTALRIVSSVYPPIDALLLLMTVQLVLSDDSRAPSFRLLLLGIGTIFLGDMGYALKLAGLVHISDTLLDTPYIVSYAAIGATALHPSMRLLTTPQPIRLRPLRRGRLITVGLGVAAPTLIVLFQPPEAPRDRTVLAVGLTVLVGAILRRTVRAVNQHAASEAVLARHATRDALTGLGNRTWLADRLESALATASIRGQALALLFLDLDRFKVVNDSWGHSVGDELLVAFAARLRGAVRGDDLVSRWGGDEFVVVAVDGSNVDAMVQRIRALFDAPFRLSVGEIVASPSIGVTISTGRDGLTAETLVRDADTAMYRAKEAGRNRTVLFSDAMHRAVRDRLAAEQALRRALASDGIDVHYQPIIDLRTGGLVGFEALARMRPRDGVVLGPDVFIPIAEDTGLIGELGETVVRAALARLDAWCRDHPAYADLYMSVNVSPRQFRDPNLVYVLADALAAHDLAGDQLHIEITEGALMDDPDKALEVLTSLRRMGISVSVDDFGTGYSSLSYLKRFPVSTVKVDRSFVAGVDEDPDDEAIVRGVLAMSSALGLQVVAEGVETARQAEVLRQHGCEFAQGWLYGRAQPSEVAELALRRAWTAPVPRVAWDAASEAEPMVS